MLQNQKLLNKLKYQKPPKQPKVQKLTKKDEHKLLTPEQFVDSLIEEKEKQLENKYSEIRDLNELIKSFKTKLMNDSVLNERMLLVNKISNKLSKMKDSSKEEKDELCNHMMDDIKKYDIYFGIKQEDLIGCSLRY